MLKLLRLLIFGDGHSHKWEIIKEVKVTSDYGAAWTRYHCKCGICGKHKTFDP